MDEKGRPGSFDAIVAREGGDADATTILVYLPGLGERGDVFEGLRSSPRLADLRHLVLDYVDWSNGVPLGEEVSFDEVADRLASWLAARVRRPVVLVGHSMGGVIAQILAERHPALVARLVDIEGNVSRDDCTFSGEAVASSLEAFIARGFEAHRQKLAAAGSAHAPTRVYAEGLRACDPAAYHAYSTPLVRLSREEALAGRLARLTMPVLYMGGEDPGRGISARSRELLGRAGVRAELIEGAGHWTYLDQPDRFVAVLRAFVEAPPAP